MFSPSIPFLVNVTVALAIGELLPYSLTVTVVVASACSPFFLQEKVVRRIAIASILYMTWHFWIGKVILRLCTTLIEIRNYQVRFLCELIIPKVRRLLSYLAEEIVILGMFFL